MKPVVNVTLFPNENLTLQLAPFDFRVHHQFSTPSRFPVNFFIVMLGRNGEPCIYRPTVMAVETGLAVCM